MIQPPVNINIDIGEEIPDCKKFLCKSYSNEQRNPNNPCVYRPLGKTWLEKHTHLIVDFRVYCGFFCLSRMRKRALRRNLCSVIRGKRENLILSYIALRYFCRTMMVLPLLKLIGFSKSRFPSYNISVAVCSSRGEHFPEEANTYNVTWWGLEWAKVKSPI